MHESTRRRWRPVGALVAAGVLMGGMGAAADAAPLRGSGTFRVGTAGYVGFTVKFSNRVSAFEIVVPGRRVVAFAAGRFACRANPVIAGKFTCRLSTAARPGAVLNGLLLTTPRIPRHLGARLYGFTNGRRSGPFVIKGP